MNATRNTASNDTGLLDSLIESSRQQLDTSSLDESVRRFRNQLPETTGDRTFRRPALGFAGVAALLLVAVFLGPQLIPGQGAAAFAQVQAWFDHYETAHIQTEMQQQGRVISSMDVWVDQRGAARIDMGPVVHIVDPDSQSMHTLLPGNQVMTVAIESGSADEAQTATDWLAELRDFQGQAERLPDTRRIQGVEATGFRLELDGVQVDLWAESTSGRPLLLEAELPGSMHMRSEMNFDQPLPERAFEVPAGYRPVTPEG